MRVVSGLMGNARDGRSACMLGGMSRTLMPRIFTPRVPCMDDGSGATGDGDSRRRLVRRDILRCGLAAATTAVTAPASAGWPERLRAARETLERATSTGKVRAAVLHVSLPAFRVTEAFGTGIATDAMFLLGSVSKPICCLATLRLIDRGRLRLDDPVARFLPDFGGAGRDGVTIRHLLTHCSGLPDQLENNATLRRNHAPLAEFVRHACRAPLAFAPGSRYAYSSMGILLAVAIASRIDGREITRLVQEEVLDRLEMRRSAQGLGRHQLADFVPCQTEHAAPESGGGDPTARTWDWNSPYWRGLGAPWGGTHASAEDLSRLLREFLEPRGAVLSEAFTREVVKNHNPPDLMPRGYGFALGAEAGAAGLTPPVFGHTGSTGTMAWADPRSRAVCVILTSLPARAAHPHPRDVAAEDVVRGVIDPAGG